MHIVPLPFYHSPDDAHSVRFQFIDLGCGTGKDRNVLPKPEGGKVTRRREGAALCSGSPEESALWGKDFRRPRWVLNPENLHPQRGSGDASFASSSRVLECQTCWWGGLKKKPRRRVRFLCMGHSLARGLF